MGLTGETQYKTDERGFYKNESLCKKKEILIRDGSVCSERMLIHDGTTPCNHM